MSNPIQTIYELGFRSWMKSFFLHRVNNKGSKYPKGSRDIRECIDVEYLKYFSHHIFLVADEINMALLKGYSLRIQNEWVIEARALKHHLDNYLINNDQYINDPMFNWEELKNVYKKIVDHLKNCPVKDVNYLKASQREDIIQHAKRSAAQDEEEDEEEEEEEEEVVEPIERDFITTAENKSETVSSSHSYSVSISESSTLDSEIQEGESSTQLHDAMILNTIFSEIQIEHGCDSKVTPYGTHSQGVVEEISSLPIQEENELQREPEVRGLTSETISKSRELEIENEFDFDETITISVTQSSVDLKLELFSSSSLEDNLFGLDCKMDNYSVGQLTGQLQPEYLIVDKSSGNPIEMPTIDEWRKARVVNLVARNDFSLPEEPYCPNLKLLFLQRNNHLTYIHPSFFHQMSVLCFLDISNTRIRTLPSSLFGLTKLQVLMLKNCICLNRVPTAVKDLKNMEALDLSGTELYDLPSEIGQLTKLRHLQISFYRPHDGRIYSHLPTEIVCRDIVSKLHALQTLSIVVNPEDKRWSEIVYDVIQDVARLKMLTNLQFYFPTIQVLEAFIMKSPSWNDGRVRKFKFVLGQDIKRIISRVPDEVESEYERHERCLRFVNGDKIPQVLKTVLERATAFYLDRHSKIKSLSEFGVSNFQELKFCVVRECPNVQVMTMDEKTSESFFPNLERMELHYLWELEKICKYPPPQGSFRLLRCLTVDMCPKLEYVISKSMLQCLQNLEEFIVQDCESLKSIIEEKVTVKHGPLLPKLRRLVLSHLPRLVTLECGLYPSKTEVKISHCPKFSTNKNQRYVKRRNCLSSSCDCNMCIEI